LYKEDEMRNYFKVCLGVLLVPIIFTGCSSEGKLKISNKTSGVVFGKVSKSEFNISGGESFSKDWDLNSSIFGSESKEVDVVYNGEYIWRDSLVAEVEAGSTKRIKLLPVAGAIKINNTNDGILDIVEVNIASESEAFWGDNDLPENDQIEPAESVSWTVTEGNWDVRIVNNLGEVEEINNIIIAIDATHTINYDGFKKSNAESGKLLGSESNNRKVEIN